ncbi:UNVERIFIED_CONTAM: hypothetical protein K2H54_033242 [Gekko kuhli]
MTHPSALPPSVDSSLSPVQDSALFLSQTGTPSHNMYMPPPSPPPFLILLKTNCLQEFWFIALIPIPAFLGRNSFPPFFTPHPTHLSLSDSNLLVGSSLFLPR